MAFYLITLDDKKAWADFEDLEDLAYIISKAKKFKEKPRTHYSSTAYIEFIIKWTGATIERCLHQPTAKKFGEKLFNHVRG